MEDWLIYLPAIASPVAVLAAYLFLKSSAKRMRKQRAELAATQAAVPESARIHDALKPVETALEKAVREILTVEESRSRERAGAGQ